ncbi:MAG: hypothetical protein M3N50_02230 [Pseudomonadota bacterium]|nr:hypothetical protein [Pseudomonadota bacterium]
MKIETLVFTTILAASASGHALASVQQGGAAGESTTTASADRNGASATNADSSKAAANSKHANANVEGSSEMTATLTKPLDARTAKPGDSVSARTDKDSKGSDGTTIQRGSTLIGHVTKAQPKSSTNGSSDSKLGFVFDKAVLKDGREVPLNSTVQAIGAAQSDSAIVGDDARGALAAGGYGAATTRGGGLLGGGAGGLARNAGGTVNTAVSGAGGLATRSAGAVGGLSAAGTLTPASRGVFGLNDFSLASAAEGSAEGAIVSSPTQNVRLDRGTKMLLFNSAEVSNSAQKSSAAAGANAGVSKSNPSP